MGALMWLEWNNSQARNCMKKMADEFVRVASLIIAGIGLLVFAASIFFSIKEWLF
jgi:hypothetical protein